MNRFEKICKEIKEVKIQGAENIAEAALRALQIKNNDEAKLKLISLRPTEPKLQNAIKYAERFGIEASLRKMKENRERIQKEGAKILKKRNKIFTHCHSSTVISIIEQGLKEKKEIEVYNTETRPLYQGRRTSKDLARLKIPNTFLVDSAMRIGIKRSDIVLLGADAILANGKVINKIGSELVAETAQRFRKKLYICTSSWAFDPRSLHHLETPMEYRDTKEVWKNAPKNIRVLNPSFEKIDPRKITGIISEFGTLKPRQFIKRIKKEEWIFSKK